MTIPLEKETRQLPPHVQKVVDYVTAATEPFLYAGEADSTAHCARVLLHGITQDAENGRLVGLTPRFISEVNSEDDPGIPLELWVQTFADGHYPLAQPGTELFPHDVLVHGKKFRKLGRDKNLSDRLQARAQILVDRRKQSDLELDDPANKDIRHDFEVFANGIEQMSTLGYWQLAKFILNLDLEDSSAA